MYNVGKSVIINLIIICHCKINNFGYEYLSSDDYSNMYDMCYKLDDDILITKLGELYEISNK